MEQGRLEDYAARYLSGASNLRGTMNGWLALHGEGSSPQSSPKPSLTRPTSFISAASA